MNNTATITSLTKGYSSVTLILSRVPMEWFIIKNNNDGPYGHPLLSTYKKMIEHDYYSDDSGGMCELD